MAEEQLFRSAIGGFNKEDVIEYIDGINRAAAENQDWFDRQSKAMAETIKRLTQENNSLKSAATSNAQEVSRLQEELRRLQDEAQAGGHSDQEVADLKRQLAEQSEALEESERRFNAVIERGDGDAVLAEKYRALEADHKSLQSAYAELKAQSPRPISPSRSRWPTPCCGCATNWRAATDRETALEQQLAVAARAAGPRAAEEGGSPKAALDSVKVESEQQVRMIQEEYDALKADTDQKLQKAQAALIEAKNRIDGWRPRSRRQTPLRTRSQNALRTRRPRRITVRSWNASSSPCAHRPRCRWSRPRPRLPRPRLNRPKPKRCWQRNRRSTRSLKRNWPRPSRRLRTCSARTSC